VTRAAFCERYSSEGQRVAKGTALIRTLCRQEERGR
jgi:hypothetical protein